MIPPIKHSTFINVSPALVYETLTTAKGWNAWFTHDMQLDLRIGGEMIFRWKNWGPNHVTTEDHARVLEIVAERKFAFLWNKHEGGTTVTFTLEPRAGGTVLHINDGGYRSMEYFIECATGWGEAMTLLKFYLEHGAIYGDCP